MRREPATERPGWREKFEELGFHFHSLDGRYWDERACFAFTAGEIDKLEAVTEELHAMCIAAVGHVLTEGRLAELAIPAEFHDYVARSWRAGEASLYGRFDLRYDGHGEPKLLEYNADTPTALIEAAIAQWNWLEEVRPGCDQFNSLHEKLIDRWRAIRKRLPQGAALHFACVRDNPEDLGNIEYLRDTALQAGIDARFIHMEDIGWDAPAQSFVDLDDGGIRALFKLYPWEWMVREAFGAHLAQSGIVLIEPAWKMILSNKGILPILWELFPDHPNLLPAFFAPGRIEGDSVEKPLYSREGANVTIRTRSATRHSVGTYGAEGFIHQAYAPLPDFGGGFVVIGSWIVGESAAGIGIREDSSPITRNTSRFLPHYFYPDFARSARFSINAQGERPMKEFIRESLGGFPPFIIYFVISAVLLVVFTVIYLRITPYREITLIKEGNAAAAASLSGAIIGFTLPLAHAIAQSVNLVDMLVWALIALVVQLATYLIVRALIPALARGIAEGKVAQGVFLGALSIAVGLLNAACMTD